MIICLEVLFRICGITWLHYCLALVTARGTRYLKFLGDGDSSSFSAVETSKPYGDIKVEKLECIGHVQKRMGTRLRKMKKELKNTPLTDGKPMRGRLPDHKIDEIQSYYGNAIRNNVTDLQKMKTAVWAIYFHRISTDDAPSHALCPEPPNTWCKFRKAQSENTLEQYNHKNSIPVAVMEAIKPVFRDLANPNLLKKCLHGKTQNVNESFNNVVWSRIPKNVFVGRETLEIGVFDSLLTFNEGNIGRLKVLRQLGFQDCGANTITSLRKSDEYRVRKSETKANEMTKEARIKRRRKRLQCEEDNDLEYGPGAF